MNSEIEKILEAWDLQDSGERDDIREALHEAYMKGAVAGAIDSVVLSEAVEFTSKLKD